MRLTEAEIAREARRVLRRLASPRAGLQARGNGQFAVGRGKDAATARVTVGEDFVAAFLRAGWVMADGPGRYVLAEDGRAFLIRSLGGEDRFAAQHRDMQAQSRDGNTVQVNVLESPLTRLQARGMVDAIHFAAGEKLRRDYTLAQLTPRLGVDLSAPAVCGGARGPGADSITDIAMAARQRFSRAMAAMGLGLADLAFDICCDLVALERAEARRGWARRSARVVLGLALDRLADHYGMTTTRQRAPIRAWSMAD